MLKDDVRVLLRIVLSVTNIPPEIAAGGTRKFVGILEVVEGHNVVDLENFVSSKLQTVGCHHFRYDIIHGDNFVVDDVVYNELVQDILRKRQNQPIPDTPQEDAFAASLEFTVELKRPENASARLTTEALQRAASGQVNAKPPEKPQNGTATRNIERFGEISPTLRRGEWQVRALVTNVRRKSEKICEMEIQDLHGTDRISCVSFEPSVSDNLLSSIRMSNVVEIRNVLVFMKNDRDRQFQMNSHPCKIIVDGSSNLKVVSDAPPAAPKVQSVVEVAAPRTTVITFGSGASVNHDYQSQSRRIESLQSFSSGSTRGGEAAAAAAFPASTYSVGSNAGPKRTVFKPPTEATSSSCGHVRPLLDSHQVKHGVTADDVKKRDAITDEADARRKLKEERVLQRRRVEVSSSCLLCGVNLEDAASIESLRKRLARIREKVAPRDSLSEFIPDDIRAQFIDESGKGDKGRIYCEAVVVSPITKRVHKVHGICAHLSTDYQHGDELGEIAEKASLELCSLCGETGAIAYCYHPECKHCYHSTCAMFSKGYINFGIRAPVQPVPACPSHTQVLPQTKITFRRSRKGPEKLGEEVCFDSSVVYLEDLRDPDDSDEE